MRKNKYMRHRAGIRKCLAIGLTAAMCMAMLAGCSTSQSTSSTSDTEVTSDVSTETDADKESPNGSADAENTSVKTEMTVEEMQAAIYAKNADKVFVTLAEGAGNSLTVSGDYVQTDDNNVDAVIFAKCDLTLGSTGSLTVKDTTGHGIVSKDDLVVTGGTYTIDSQDHCLKGKDSVRIADGTFNLSCDEDGIHAGNDDQQDGYVYIEGGDINISVGDDALHAE